MIVVKSVNNKDTLVVECKTDILFSSTKPVNDTVNLGISEYGKPQDLDRIIEESELSYDDYPPKIFIEFHHIKSIDNLIDQLKQCKELLTESRKEQ